jgi:ferric-dicitrate binding protein FerR (iron transport regulator)
MSDAALTEAFSAWADGAEGEAATADAADVLVRLLGQDPAARGELVEYALLEATLHRAYPPIALPWWRRPMRFRGWGGALIIGLALLGWGVAWLVSRPTLIIAAYVDAGSVRVGGKVATELPAETDLVVAENAPAMLRLRDGSMITAKPGSRLRVRPLDGEGSAYEVELRAGGAEFRLVPGCRSFTVTTPFGSARAQGPWFGVSVDTPRRRNKLDGPLKTFDQRLSDSVGP